MSFALVAFLFSSVALVSHNVFSVMPSKGMYECPIEKLPSTSPIDFNKEFPVMSNGTLFSNSRFSRSNTTLITHQTTNVINNDNRMLLFDHHHYVPMLGTPSRSTEDLDSVAIVLLLVVNAVFLGMLLVPLHFHFYCLSYQTSVYVFGVSALLFVFTLMSFLRLSRQMNRQKQLSRWTARRETLRSYSGILAWFFGISLISQIIGCVHYYHVIRTGLSLVWLTSLVGVLTDVLPMLRECDHSD